MVDYKKVVALASLLFLVVLLFGCTQTTPTTTKTDTNKVGTITPPGTTPPGQPPTQKTRVSPLGPCDVKKIAHMKIVKTSVDPLVNGGVQETSTREYDVNTDGKLTAYYEDGNLITAEQAKYSLSASLASTTVSAVCMNALNFYTYSIWKSSPSPDTVKYMQPNFTGLNNWFKEKPIIGKNLSWAKYTEVTRDGKLYVQGESRDFGPKVFADENNVNISFTEIDTTTGFPTKSITIDYPAVNATSIDSIDTTKTIDQWVADHAGAKVTFSQSDYTFTLR